MKKIGDAEKFVGKCPKGVLEVKAGKVVLADAVDTDIDLLSKCADLAPNEGMEISFKDDSFIIRIDNYGNMKTDSMFVQATEVLREKAQDFRKELKKL